MYITVAHNTCQRLNLVDIFTYHAARTLVIDDEKSEDGPEDGPTAHIGHVLGHRLELGRYLDVGGTILEGRQRRRRRIGGQSNKRIHAGCFYERLVAGPAAGRGLG